jgi:hypothetical protein
MNQTGSGSYGSIVALSADGKTALVGDPGENGFGAVLAFTDSASGWVQDGPRITAAGRPRGFGKSVALSADGNTALIGAGEGVTGAAFLFKRTGPTWTQQPGNLSVEYELGDGNFGSSIALSADGDSAVIGADGQRPEPPMAGAGPAIGAAYPFEFVAESPEPPAAITGAASSITPTSAELSATVNPQGGRVTRCRFEYGPTESYGESAPCYPSPGSGEGPVSVSASVTRLSPGTAYHFRITARNRSGRRSGLDQQFMTESPRAPTVFADPASSITSDSATLNATVDPNGGRIRSCRFEYGTTTSYGSSVRCPVAAGAGEGPVTESLDVPGLAEDTEYYFRIVARNATGSSYDGARAFTTASRGSLVQLAPGTPTEGGSIALSADGSTLLVGSSDDDWGGSVRIYVRSGPGWRLQARLVDGEIDANFGDPVAVSSDGNTALIGSSGEGGDEGDADVFTRTGGVWSEQASLAGTPRFILTYWGRLLALSGDGDTALVGSSFRDHLFLGERAGSKWAPASAQIPALVAEGHPEEHPYLSGLAISADGSTVLVRLSGSGSYLVNGEPELEDAGASVVLAFTLSGSTWQAQTLDPTAAIGEPDFGSSMTLSDDGNTALIGGPGDDGGVGAAWAFTRSGTTWTQGGEKLTADNETGAGDFGSSVALSADGSRALIGGPDDDAGAGAAWTFTRSGESFTQQPSKLTSSEGGTGFGSSVSLTGEGNEAVIAGDGGFWTFGPEPEGDPHRHHR